jgi:hypothetical protein
MKTVKDVQKEMSELTAEIKILDRKDDKKSIAARKRLRARLPQLKYYILYLETNPSEDYCKKEVAKLTNRMDEILKQYEPPQEPERFTKGQLSAMKKQFEKLWEIPKLRKQAAAINYILK